MTLRPSHSLLLILAAILLMGCGHHRFEAPTGNLLSRTINGVQETFTYDSLDRLTSVSRNGSTTLSTTYSDGGSILYKSDIGNYTYNGLAWRPHAVMEVENTDSLIPPVNQTLTYNADNKLSSIRDGMGRRCDIVYGPDGKRWTSTSTVNGALQKTLFYAGNTDGIWTDQTHYTFYLWLPGDVLCVDKVTGTEHDRQFYYLATDHLGSICEVMKADDDLTSVFHADYDAWGRQAVTRDSIGIYRGYTGHEMLPEFGLINMNGRMYDPLLGRFLSPDNYVQLPDLSQSFNRYSYCLNNPLKYTDPSGENPVAIAAIVGAIIGGTANVISNWDNIHNIWYGIGCFGVGALAGAASGATVVGISSALGISGAIGGAVAGAGGGFVQSSLTGLGNTLIQGNDWSMAINNAWKGGLYGAGFGAVMGFAVGGISSVNTGKSFWTGKTKIPTNFVSTIEELPAYETAQLGEVSEIIGNNEVIPQRINPYQKGLEGVEMAMEEFQLEGGTVVAREVTIEVNGIRVRLDFVGYDSDGMLHLFEIKNGPYAHLTPNQKIVWPQIETQSSLCKTATPTLNIIPYGRNAMRVQEFMNLVPTHQPYSGNFRATIIRY